MADRDISVRASGRVESAASSDHLPERRQQQQPAPQAPQSPASASPERVGNAASTSGHIRPAVAQMMVDERTGQASMRIIDPLTNEVIREIPAEELERVSDGMRDYSGMLARYQLGTQQKPAA